jgi:hypothetical protein
MTSRRPRAGSTERDRPDLPSLLITHGRNQAMTDPVQMKRDWSGALIRGLERIGYRDAKRIRIDLAFYGDLWRPGVERLERGAKPSDMQVAFARELLARRGVAPERLGWDTLARLIALVDEKLRVGDALLELFMRDLDDYFEDARLRSRADDRVAAKATALGGRVILLAHSMGSIVGYHLLSKRGAELPGLFGLVTFGSPLGMDTIHDRVAGLIPGTPFPDSLQRWANVWNEKDFATVVRELAPLFPVPSGGRQVEDVGALAGEPDIGDLGRGHDPLAYLGSTELAEAVVALIEGRPVSRGPHAEPPVSRGPHAEPPVTMAAGFGRGERAAPPALPSELLGRGERAGVGSARPGTLGFARPQMDALMAPRMSAGRSGPSSQPRATGAGRTERTSLAEHARRPERATMTARATRPAPAARAARASRPAHGTAPAQRTVERTASADFPPVVAPGSEHDLVFAIGHAAVFARASGLLIEVPPDVSSVDLRVGVYAPEFEVRTEAGKDRPWAPVTLPLDGDGEVRGRFRLRARPTRQRLDATIYLTFYRGGTPVGHLELATVVDPAHVARAGAIRVSLAAAPDADLTFVVTDRSLEAVGAGPFDIRVSREGVFFEKPLGQFRVTMNAVSEAHGFLERFHDVAEIRDPRRRIRAIAEIGSALWWLLPDGFRKFYWDEMHGHDLTVAVYSQEPYIPWELVAPQRTRRSRPEPMLGVSFAIARWTQGLPFPDPVARARIGVVAPDYDGGDALPSARAEADALIARFGAVREKATRRAVRKLLGSDTVDVVHFSGHGSFDPQVVELSQISLADDPLTPSDLPSPDPRQDRPFVFLNACQVGESGFELTEIGGWAVAFCEAGSAGFVGPYWAVDDQVARRAAETFYGELAAGKTVAQAVRAIRQRFATDPDDRGHPSWLAYTLHCQPNVTLGLGPG